MMESILVPLGAFTMCFGIVAAAVWGATKSRQELHETMRRALENGQVLTPETIGALHKPMRTADQDFRSGIILVALALGLVAAGTIPGLVSGGFERENLSGFLVAAFIVGGIGVGQLIAGVARKTRKDP
jgi:hypothetical protein